MSLDVGSIGIWFSGVTLWFLWIQIQDAKRGIKSSTYQNVAQAMIDIDKIFIEKPELKPYFYSKKASAQGELIYPRLLSAAEMFLDFFDNIYHQKSCMPIETFDGYTAFMRDIYKCSPVLRELLSQKEEWFSKGFVGHIKDDSKTSPNGG